MAEEDCRKIEVKGISEQTSQETLENYFSSKKRGGEISHIQYERGKRTACITFERPEGAQQALQFKPHCIDNVQLIVQRKTAGQVESNKLYIEGFREDINNDYLKYYVENISETDVSYIAYGPRCNAIMTMVGELDFDRIHQRSQTKLLEGKMLTIKRVPVCRTILVTGLPPSATEDSMLFKFESIRSGGGDVEHVEMNQGERTALIEFKEPAVLLNVLSQDQTLDGVQLTVKPYYSLLGGLGEKQPQITSRDTRASEPVVAIGQPSFPSTQPRDCEPVVINNSQPSLASTIHHVKIDRDLYNYLEKFHPQNLKLALKNRQRTVDDGEDTVVFAMETNEAEKELKAFLKDYKCEVVEFDAVLAERGLQLKMSNVHQAFESRTAVSFQECYNKGRIKIVGRAVRQHAMAVEQVERCVNETKKEYEVETKHGEELIEVSRVNLKLLQISEKFRASERAWAQQGVDVRLVTDSGVLVKGGRNQVKKVKSEIEQLVGSFSQRELDAKPSLLLMSHGALTYVTTLLFENDLKVEISINDSKTTTLHSFEQTNVDEAYQYIISTVREIKMPLRETNVSFRRQEFQEEFAKFVGPSVPISLQVENDELTVVCFEKDLHDVSLKVTDFLEGKKHKEVYVPFEKIVGRYLQLQGENTLEGLRLSSPGIAIELRPDTVIISGPQPLVASCESSIKEVIQGLSKETMKFGKPETCMIMTSEPAKKTISDIEEKRRCAILVNVSDESEEPISRPATRSTDTEKMKELMEKTLQCRYTYPSGKIIEVHQGDILDHPVDFLVNAANAELKHSGGIAKAIVDKGGHKIQEDCFNILKEKGKPKLMPSDVVVTDAGDLLCTKVLHVVVPKWKNDGSSDITEGTTEGRFLRHACLGVLNEAKDGKTIAMPALGTGIYKIPHVISAKSLITATDEFVRANTHCCLKEIHFVDNEPKAVEAFMKEMTEKYGSDPNFHINERVRHRWAPASRVDVPLSREVLPDSGSVFSTKEGMTIELTIGNIATCKVDLIINTVHGDMDLTKNPCSQAILQVAGQQLTKYCEEWAKKNGELKSGSFAVTGGAKLKCKKIFHVRSPQWNADDGEKKLGEVVQSVLSEAARLNLTSIAIPALGTGKLRYPEETVAKVLFEEAIKFSASHGASVSLKQVNIVIYNGNATAVEKFKEKFQFYSTKRKPAPNARRTRRTSCKNAGQPFSSETPPMGKRESYETRERPCESAAESVSVVESNELEIKIVQGDMVQESTDAIALLVGNIITQSGQLGEALKLKAGKPLTNEYASITKVDPGTVVVTSAGDLNVKYLFHMVPKKTLITENISSKSIREAIIKCLEEAEIFQLESISLPAVGTGVLKKDSDVSAGNLHASISEYAKRPSRSLKLIRIVILQPNVFDEFCTGFMKNQRENPLPRCSVSVNNKGSGKVEAGNSGQTARARTSLSLDIVGDRSCNMAEIKRELSRIEQERRHYKDIDNEVIAELPQTYLDEIMELQTSHFVQIECKREMGFLRLSGLSENVSEAADKIYKKILAYCREKLSVTVSSQAGQWLFYDGSEGDEDIVIPEQYPADISGQIEKAYQEDFSSVKICQDDVKYKIDFKTMVETNLATEETMNVYRSSREGFPLPECWDCQPIARATGQEEEVYLVQIDPHGQPKEFDTVYEMFNKSMPNATIESIQRIQNPRLYQIYKSQQKKMNECSGCNEQHLFHGTSKETMASINSKGFNRAFCGKNAIRFGKGVYFAREAKYSSRKIYAVPDENGVQYMYVAQVLAGQYTKGKEDIIVPPPIHDNNPNICYDTVVDDVSKPNMFVVFYDYQCYPQYLISFKDTTK